MRKRIKILGIFCLIFISHYGLATPKVYEKSSFLVVSDIHLNPDTQHKMEFSPKNNTIRNDLDTSTFKAMVETLQTQIQAGEIDSPQFILLLGDLVGHLRDTRQKVIDSEQIVLSILKDAFPSTPLFLVFGNNDSFKKDYGIFRSSGPSDKYHSPLDIMNSVWSHSQFLSTGTWCKREKIYPCLIKTNTTDGYYSAYIKPSLRLIALNSVMFSGRQSGYSQQAPLEQLSWLQQQLQDVTARKEKAILAMHIPPGDNVYKAHFWSDPAFWHDDYQRIFYNLVKHYHLSIIGILAAHTHKDEIKLIQHSDGTSLIGVYLNAAMSTSHGNAPSVRSYVLNSEEQKYDWDLSDYQTYYYKDRLSLSPLYQFQEYYCGKLESHSLKSCFSAISIDKIQYFMNAGNANFHEHIAVPENIYINK